MTTHIEYIKQVASIATLQLPEDERAALDSHLTYSLGSPGLRGVTYYGAWKNGKEEPIPFVEVCALGEENDVQLAGTTIHELGHVLAGLGSGHSHIWKAACERLGLRRPKATGNMYTMSQFAPSVRLAIAALISPTDGKPVGLGLVGPGQTVRVKPCAAGIGTRGGTSRGTGSGSRMRRFICDCTPPVIVRTARDTFDATCHHCTGEFHN